MKTLFTQQTWFDHLLPQGLPIPSSIILSGPGGSGKPLIGNLNLMCNTCDYAVTKPSKSRGGRLNNRFKNTQIV